MIDFSFRMTDRFLCNDIFQRLSHEFGLIFEGKASWTRRLGGIRQRAHPRWLQQRRQNHHATHCAQGRVQFQLASASPQHGRSPQDTALVLQGSDRRRKLGGLASSPFPPPLLQISNTILTQAHWRAVRAVARCEQGHQGLGSLALIGEWEALLHSRRFIGQNKCACGMVGGLSSRFPQAQYTTVVRFWAPIVPWKGNKSWSAGASSGSEQDVGSPEALILYRQTSSRTAHTERSFPTGRACRESVVQIGLALLARNCGDRMHDSPSSRACCFSVVQCVRTAQSTGALSGVVVPVGLYA